METDKQLGPFKIKIELDGFTPKMEEFVNSRIGSKITEMPFLGIPWTKNSYQKSTYVIRRNSISNWIRHALKHLWFYSEENTQ